MKTQQDSEYLIAGHIGRSWRYENTPIGQVTEQAKRDMDLIRSDVERKDWQSVISGVKYQVDAFTELLNNLKELDAKGLL
jgi:hypothetical protein